LLWIGEESDAFQNQARALTEELHPAVAKLWGLRKDGASIFLELELFEPERLDGLRALYAGAAVNKTGTSPFVGATAVRELLGGGASRQEKTRVILPNFAGAQKEPPPPPKDAPILTGKLDKAQVMDLSRLRAAAEQAAAEERKKKLLMVGLGLLVLGLLIVVAVVVVVWFG
jgi:hypothetical protein